MFLKMKKIHCHSIKMSMGLVNVSSAVSRSSMQVSEWRFNTDRDWESFAGVEGFFLGGGEQEGFFHSLKTGEGKFVFMPHFFHPSIVQNLRSDSVQYFLTC